MEENYQYEEFLKAVHSQVEKAMPQYLVTRESKIKTNDMILQGIQVRKESEDTGHCIYLEHWYEQYQNGRELEDIVNEVIRTLETEMKWQLPDTSPLFDYEQVRSHICYSLINPSYNAKLLKQRPHTPFLDLEKVYEIDAGFLLPDAQPARVGIRYGMLETWGVTEEEIRKEAERNTPQIRRPCLMSMEEALGGIAVPASGMYVLTNEQSLNGAAVLAYPGVAEWLADTLKTDFYVLPSSVHETILLTADGPRMNEKELTEMIQEVNKTCVGPEEWLGDHPYKYDKTLGILMPVGLETEKKEVTRLGDRTEKRPCRC